MRRAAGLRKTAFALAALVACSGDSDRAPDVAVVTFPGSAVGEEAELLSAQLARFERAHPKIRVVQRRTPDAADDRRQLYVQWLNAGADDPDVLQLDVIWTPEFAAAGWLLPLDELATDVSDLFPATLAANLWGGQLFAVPWFVDVGLLYWRTDLVKSAPETYEELVREASTARERGDVRYGLVWQGARYEGLLTVFVEHLNAFGGGILDATGAVAVDSDAAVRALGAMCAAVGEQEIVPRSALGWHEEETRFAFQNGEALFMRNWPYAYTLMQDERESSVAGRFATALFPRAAGGTPGATLGGSQLGINANSDEPRAAWAVINYLTRPEQMRERALKLGQYPPRRSLYQGDGMATGLALEPERARHIIAHAIPRPVTPVYAQLSELLQVQLHRALSGQVSPEEALAGAADEMRALLDETDLAGGRQGGAR